MQAETGSKTFRTPRRPFEKERLDNELLLIGQYGLKNKREVWRVQYMLAKIRKAARMLLTLDETDPKRMFEGEALLRRMVRLGVLGENEKKLDYVLGLTVAQFMERRLQTLVYNKNLAKSIHEARILIRQKQLRVGKQLVDIPSFMVRTSNEAKIDYSHRSFKVTKKLGRTKRRKAQKPAEAGDGEDD